MPPCCDADADQGNAVGVESDFRQGAVLTSGRSPRGRIVFRPVRLRPRRQDETLRRPADGASADHAGASGPRQVTQPAETVDTASAT